MNMIDLGWALNIIESQLSNNTHKGFVCNKVVTKLQVVYNRISYLRVSPFASCLFRNSLCEL